MTATRRLLPLLLLALAATVAAGPVSAAKPTGCAKAIIADWFDNNRVDRIYKPLSCYRDAINALPTDVEQYTDAAEDIRRAWALARKGKADTGRPDGQPGTSDGGAAGTGAGTGGGSGGGATPGGGTGSVDETPTAGGPSTGSGTDSPAGGATLAAADPSSVPVALIVVGGLAGLLLVLGGVGYLSRRAATETLDVEPQDAV